MLTNQYVRSVPVGNTQSLSNVYIIDITMQNVKMNATFSLVKACSKVR